eukprot:364631-Chlamydomonas_euryale.AAC.10
MSPQPKRSRPANPATPACTGVAAVLAEDREVMTFEETGVGEGKTGMGGQSTARGVSLTRNTESAMSDTAPAALPITPAPRCALPLSSSAAALYVPRNARPAAPQAQSEGGRKGAMPRCTSPGTPRPGCLSGTTFGRRGKRGNEVLRCGSQGR